MKSLKWLGLVLLTLTAIGGATFWRFPLHVQAHLPLLGEFLTERPSPEEWAAAAADPLADQRLPWPVTQDYFPERTFALSNDGRSFMEISLAEQLKGLGEQSLYLRRKDPLTHIYRFTWSRSFDPQIVVRLEIGADGTGQLICKHFGLRPVGKEKVTISERKVSKRRVSKIVAQFEQAAFWDAPADDDIYGLDGATWLWEGCRGGKYHVVKRSGGNVGDPMKKLGLDLLEFAGFWRGPVY